MRTAAQERVIEAAYADTMACAARAWRERALNAERTLALAVRAAGGEVTIGPEFYRSRITLERYEDKTRASTVLRVK